MIELASQPLPKVCSIQMGQSPPSSDYNEVGNGIPFFQGKAEFGPLYPTPCKWIEKPIRIAEPNDVLLSVRAPVGAVNFANTRCCIGRGLAALRFSGNPKYLYYFLLSKQHYLDSLGTGTTFKAINKDALEGLEVPLPRDRHHQDLLVSKIDSLFAEIDTGTEVLKQTKAKLDLYKQSVLNAAIQGKLVRQDPNDEPASKLLERIRAEKDKLIKEGKIKKEKPLPPIDPSDVPFDLPKGWEWVRVGDIVQTLSTGPFGTMLHKSDYVPGGIPLVNPKNIVSGKIVPLDNMRVASETAARLSPYILKTGDVVLGRRGEMGRASLVSEKEDGWLCGTGSFFLRLSSPINTQYFYLFFTSELSKAFLNENAIGTTMKNLNHEIIKSQPIPLPSLETQNRIVQMTHGLEDQIFEQRKDVQLLLEKTQILKQSVLKAAFEGRLL
jgi:type I restriction enzyme S subunit